MVSWPPLIRWPRRPEQRCWRAAETPSTPQPRRPRRSTWSSRSCRALRGSASRPATWRRSGACARSISCRWCRRRCRWSGSRGARTCSAGRCRSPRRAISPAGPSWCAPTAASRSPRRCSRRSRSRATASRSPSSASPRSTSNSRCSSRTARSTMNGPRPIRQGRLRSVRSSARATSHGRSRRSPPRGPTCSTAARSAGRSSRICVSSAGR